MQHLLRARMRLPLRCRAFGKTVTFARLPFTGVRNHLVSPQMLKLNTDEAALSTQAVMTVLRRTDKTVLCLASTLYSHWCRHHFKTS
jgi:hypothetical protein